jgi:prepilin-type N-terminal cleavage/methylation domain-containing protein
MIRHIRDIKARRTDQTLEPGFTLIELLIVIVVLGILAATVIFALGGVTSQSAQAACNSDAKSYEVAVEAFKDYPGGTGSYPTQAANLKTGIAGSGAFVRQLSNNTHFTVGLWKDTGVPATPTPYAGEVWVKPGNGPAIDYDTQTSTTGCNTPNM